MVNRSEEDKLIQKPLKVILGGKEYNIAPLVIKYSGEWRKKSLPLIQFLIGYGRKSEDEMLDAVTELYTTKTDEIIESFFEYARFDNKTREEVEGIATDGEIIIAFMEVFNAFVSPLSEPAMKAPGKKAQVGKRSR